MIPPKPDLCKDVRLLRKIDFNYITIVFIFTDYAAGWRKIPAGFFLAFQMRVLLIFQN